MHAQNLPLTGVAESRREWLECWSADDPSPYPMASQARHDNGVPNQVERCAICGPPSFVNLLCQVRRRSGEHFSDAEAMEDGSDGRRGEGVLFWGRFTQGGFL